MGFEPHAEIEQPSDDTMLWRYMDLGKYLDLLSTSSVAMPRASVMRDPYEGEIGPFSRQLPLQLVPGAAPSDAAGLAEAHANLRSKFRDYTYISCWHAAEHESAGMWSLYADENKGVAITTTWGALKASTTIDVPVYGGRVKYVDYDTYRVPELQVATIYCHKRLSFRHEQEVRLFVQDRESALHHAEPPQGWTKNVGPAPFQHPAIREAEASGAFRLPARLQALVHQVKVSPTADPWFVSAVQNVTRQYGGQWDVTQSDLYTLR